MKKFFAILICSIIIFCHFVPIVPGQAAEVVIEQGIDFFYKSWDMIYSLINGGVIQTSPYQGIADQTTALAAYYDDWGENLLKAINYIVPSDDAIINSQSAITFPLKLGMTRQYYNQFISDYMNYAIDPSEGYKAALTGDAIAAWNRYNNQWLQKYINAFSGDNPTATPDPNYMAYINRINERNSSDSTAFWFYNFVQNQPGATNNLHIDSYPITDYSWVTYSDYTFPSSVGSLLTPYMMPTQDIISINIFSQNGSYSYSVSGNSNGKFVTNNSGFYWQYGYLENSNNNITISGLGQGYRQPTGFSYSYSKYNTTLSACFDDIAKHFKNVNIYVDGVLWAFVGGTEPTFTAPDVITNQDGIILGHDVYFPEQDLYIDLISWRNLLEDKIADGDSIDFDDLINGGVIIDSNDIPVTNEDQETLFKKKDASVVIDLGLEDADTSDLLPDAPSPPDDDPTDWNFPEFPIPDLNDGGDPQSTGLSVLARIINVTNKSLPPELISMFWGICITLIILGIIKILHK